MAEDLKHAERIAELIVKFNAGKISQPENTELMNWRESAKGNQALFSQLTNPVYLEKKLHELKAAAIPQHASWERVMTVINESKP